MAPRDQIKRSV